MANHPDNLTKWAEALDEWDRGDLSLSKMKFDEIEFVSAKISYNLGVICLQNNDLLGADRVSNIMIALNLIQMKNT